MLPQLCLRLKHGSDLIPGIGTPCVKGWPREREGKKKKRIGSSHCGKWINDLVSLCGIAGLIPGPVQLVKDLVLPRCSSDSITENFHMPQVQPKK